MQLRFAAILSTCAIIAGCSGTQEAPSDPLDDVARLSEVVLPEGTSQEDAVAAALAIAAPPETEESGGIFGRILGERESEGGNFLSNLLPASTTDENTPVARTGPDAQVIQFGESVPYGEIATVCDVSSRDLGTKIASISGYKIYDSIPNATAQRPQFITGFPDGCARQFTAALTVTGDVGTHEVVRYLPSNKSVSYSATDSAYEALKASFCRTAHGTPCGSRIDALSDTTAFITAYERFESSPRWVEILLHDGEVMAIDFKKR